MTYYVILMVEPYFDMRKKLKLRDIKKSDGNEVEDRRVPFLCGLYFSEYMGR